jgi:hypothetical protein
MHCGTTTRYHVVTEMQLQEARNICKAATQVSRWCSHHQLMRCVLTLHPLLSHPLIMFDDASAIQQVPHLPIKVHAHSQAEVQQRSLAVRRLELHAAHHFQPGTCRLLAVRLLPRLRALAGWVAEGWLLLLLWVV